MNNSVLYIAILTTMLSLTGCGGGGSEESKFDITRPIESTLEIALDGIFNGPEELTLEFDGDQAVIIDYGDSVFNTNPSVVPLGKPLIQDIRCNTTSCNGLIGVPKVSNGILDSVRWETVTLTKEDDAIKLDNVSLGEQVFKPKKEDVQGNDGQVGITLTYDASCDEWWSVLSNNGNGRAWRDINTFEYIGGMKFGTGFKFWGEDKFSMDMISGSSDVVNSGNIVMKDNSETGYWDERGFHWMDDKTYCNLSFHDESGLIYGMMTLDLHSLENGKLVTVDTRSAGRVNQDSKDFSSLEVIFKLEENLYGADTDSSNGSGTGNNNSSSKDNSDNTYSLCTSTITSDGTTHQCVGKDKINYLGGGFVSHIGDIANLYDISTGDVQTATSCSVTRSGNTITINIPSLGVSSSVFTAEELQVLTLGNNSGQSLVFLTRQGDYAGMSNIFFNGKTMQNSTVTVGTKTYTCSKY